MLVSSSGWAHSPITLILIGLSSELVVGGAALPGIAMLIAIAAAVSTAPVKMTRKRFIDRTSEFLLKRTTGKWGSVRTRWSARTHSRDIEQPGTPDPTTARPFLSSRVGLPFQQLPN